MVPKNLGNFTIRPSIAHLLLILMFHMHCFLHYGDKRHLLGLLRAGLRVHVASFYSVHQHIWEKPVPGPPITTILALIGSSTAAKMLQIYIVSDIFVILHVTYKSCFYKSPLK